MKIGKITFGFIVFGIILVFYTLSLSPCVSLIDSGEFALVAKNLGIAHPTGYPLYTLIARLFDQLLPMSSVLATNFMSAFFGAMACMLFFLIFAKDKSYIFPAVIALAMGLSRTLWQASVETEVYSLELFLNLAAIGLFYKVFFDNGKQTADNRLLPLAFFAFGLAFTNHMHSILFVPSVIFLIVIQRKSLDIKQIPVYAVLFLLGLSVYFYLPVRASSVPEPNWGNPSSFGNFFRHVSGWQYQVWMFASRDVIWPNLKNFANLYLQQSFYILPFMTIASIVLLAVRKRWTLLTFWVIVIFADIVYSVNYKIPDIDAYFIPAYLASFALVIEAGRLIEKRWMKYFWLCLSIVMLLGSAYTNYKANDRSNDYFARNIAYTTLLAAPHNSLVFIDSWDFFAPTRYIQKEYGFRDDVVLVDLPLLKRSWYLQELLEHYPDYFQPSRLEINRFLEEVRPFERRQQHDPQRIENAYRSMIFSIIERNIASDIEVYGLVRWEPMNQRYYREPEGFLTSYDISRREHRKRFPTYFFWDEMPVYLDEECPRRRSIITIISNMLLARVVYLSNMELYEEAIPFMRRLLEIHPDNRQYIENYAVLYVKAGLYEEAKDAFKLMEDYVDDYQMQMIYKDLDNRIMGRRAVEFHQNERHGQ